MATPTEKVTKRAQDLLGEPVTIAMRVRLGPASAADTGSNMLLVTSMIWSLVAAPFLAIVRLAGRAGDVGQEGSNHCVLACTESGQRLLLSATSAKPGHPTELRHRFSPNAELHPNIELMHENFVAELTVDESPMFVNPVDFKALVIMVEEGRLDAPAIAKNARILRPHSKFVGAEPESFLK